uniref:Uncharacterized protein n=1 Tax=Lygus hesperus TaxID=30085 RepID=A0A0K8S5J1_LYGHE
MLRPFQATPTPYEQQQYSIHKPQQWGPAQPQCYPVQGTPYSQHPSFSENTITQPFPLNPSLPHHPPQFCRVGGGNSFHRHLKKSGKSFVGSPVGSAYVYYQPAALSNLMAS